MTGPLLVIAAHPDDEVLGCGATIAKARAQGRAVRVAFLAEGITARYSLEEAATAAVQDKSRIRNQNALKALAVLGVEADAVYLGERYCCRLDQVPQIDLVKEIEGHIRDVRPSEILTHWSQDTNVDHRAAHWAMLAATRPVGMPSVGRILAFEVLSSSEWNTTTAFPANAFQDVTAYMDLKVAAMAAYGDEMQAAPHPRSEEVIRALGRFRGSQVGVGYAEAFSLMRSLD